MVGTLLLRGMLVGAVAGLLAFGFARLLGEPPIDRAIAFEAQLDRAKGEAPEPVLVSRQVQSGLGLFTGIVVYGTAIGGLFALVFAAACGRVGHLDPRALAALLALVGFVAIVLVPQIKYPASPPSVGAADTIRYRTALFFMMLAVSVAAMGVAVAVARRLAASLGLRTAALAAAAAFILLVALAMVLLPGIDEVPAGFPASVLWRFRLSALGTQLVLWTALGLLFGWLTERSLSRRPGVAAEARRPLSTRRR